MSKHDTNQRQKSCVDRVQAELADRMADIRKLWKMYCEGIEAGDEDLGRFEEYGLCFDYVAPGTFQDQREGYFRYQLSWGGPSDEFRIYANADFSAHRIEYWFLDWFDGASIDLDGADFELIDEIWQNYFVAAGAAQAELERS